MLRGFRRPGVTVRLGELAYQRAGRRQTVARKLGKMPVAVELSSKDIREWIAKGGVILRFVYESSGTRLKRYPFEIAGNVYWMDCVRGAIADIKVMQGTYAFRGPKRSLAGRGGGMIVVDLPSLIEVPFSVGAVFGAKVHLHSIRVVSEPPNEGTN